MISRLFDTMAEFWYALVALAGAFWYALEARACVIPLW